MYAKVSNLTSALNYSTLIKNGLFFLIYPAIEKRILNANLKIKILKDLVLQAFLWNESCIFQESILLNFI